jgi:hypothetical protein
MSVGRAQLSRAIVAHPWASNRVSRIRLRPTPPKRCSRGPTACPTPCRRPDLFVSKALGLSAPIGALTSVGLSAGKRGVGTRFRISLRRQPRKQSAQDSTQAFGSFAPLGHWALHGDHHGVARWKKPRRAVTEIVARESA